MFFIQHILKCNLKIHFGNQKSKKMGLFLDVRVMRLCDNIYHYCHPPPHPLITSIDWDDLAG